MRAEKNAMTLAAVDAADKAESGDAVTFVSRCWITWSSMPVVMAWRM